MRRPLDGLVVLDLTQYLSGPFCTLVLAGLGATIVKVEPLSGDVNRQQPPFVGRGGVVSFKEDPDAISAAFLKRNRSKRSITLNLKAERGRELLYRLVGMADVLVHNYRPGVSDRLRIDYDTLRAKNPRLVYCAISGFGEKGRYAHWPAFDIIAQAMSGLMATTGHTDGEPLRCGAPIGDLASSLYAAIGVLAALHDRQATGRGQAVNVAMLDSISSLLWDEPLDFYLQAGEPPRRGNRFWRASPFNSYRTRDGFVVICAFTNAHWTNILTAIGRDDLVGDPRLADNQKRIQHNDIVDRALGEWCQGVTTAHAVEQLQETGAPCAPVLEPEDILGDDELREWLLEDVVHPLYRNAAVKGCRLPLRFSDSLAEFSSPAPVLGQDNEGIYGGWLDLGEEEQRTLRDEGVI